MSGVPEVPGDSDALGPAGEMVVAAPPGILGALIAQSEGCGISRRDRITGRVGGGSAARLAGASRLIPSTPPAPTGRARAGVCGQGLPGCPGPRRACGAREEA